MQASTSVFTNISRGGDRKGRKRKYHGVKLEVERERERENELSWGDYKLNKPQRARRRTLSRLIFYFPPADLGPQPPPPVPRSPRQRDGVGEGWELSPRCAHDPNCPISEMSICPRARPHFSSGRTMISRRTGQPNALSLPRS